MATAMLRPVTKTTPAALVKVEVKGSKLITPLRDAVEELTVTTEEEYQQADELLATIRQARRQWAAEIEPVLTPLRLAKTAADALNRKIDVPLGELEASVKATMKDYKVQEAAEIAREQARIDAAQSKIQAQLEDTAARELAAKTKQMRERLATKRTHLEEQAEAVEAEAPVAIRAAHSSTRIISRWRIVDMDAFIKGVVSGAIPKGVLMLDYAFMNKHHLTGRDSMAGWPGCELYDDTVIVGRG